MRPRTSKGIAFDIQSEIKLKRFVDGQPDEFRFGGVTRTTGMSDNVVAYRLACWIHRGLVVRITRGIYRKTAAYASLKPACDEAALSPCERRWREFRAGIEIPIQP